MNKISIKTGSAIGALLLLPLNGYAFNSGSTGADGAFNPVTDTELQLPPDGVLNFTSVNIPSLVKITFRRNTANTPVVILAQGDIVVAGTIDAIGKAGAPTGPGVSDGGDPTDDGLPGEGGPGGFDGGRGGLNTTNAAHGGNGLGPGGGAGGGTYVSGGSTFLQGGGHGSHGSSGSNRTGYAAAGATYGNELLRPLIGGSGGGGGYAVGSGGGGGGGAILLAASGEIRLDGTINAYGRAPGEWSSVRRGGGGSGGAIRLVATRISGRGALNAPGWNYSGDSAGTGRIRVEAETLTGSIGSDPTFTYSEPTDLFIPGLPGLAITSVAGLPVPANPVGQGDVALAAATPNPVDVTLRTNGVPLGTVIQVTMTPEFGATTTVSSPPTTGSLDNATASVSLNIPDGRSIITATTTFTVTAAVGEQFAPYAQGERVESVRLTATPGQPSSMVLLTSSGREVAVPAAALAAGW